MVEIDFSRDLAFPAATVWALLEDFGNMSWTPGVDRVELIGDGIGMTRRLHMEGMEPIDEVLQTRDAASMSYSYSIPRGIPLPVTDYLASARVEPVDAAHCRVHWHCHCTPTDATMSAQELETLMHSTYNMLLDWAEAHLRRGNSL